MTKIIGITVFLFGLLAVLATYEDLIPFYVNDDHQKIETLWRQDIELLVKTGSLPKQFTEISEIKVFPLSDGSKKLIQNIKLPVLEKKEGAYRLEITLDDWKDIEASKSEYGIMIQYNLIDIKSQNTIWELGRTLIMDSEVEQQSIPTPKKDS